MKKPLLVSSIGLVGGIGLDVLAYYLAGYGHGTYVPFALFFGPLMPEVYGGVYRAFLFGPALYAGYGFLLYSAVRRGRGVLALCVLMLFHYVLGAVNLHVLSTHEDIGYRFGEAWHDFPLRVSGAALLFFLLNVLAVLFVLWGKRR